MVKQVTPTATKNSSSGLDATDEDQQEEFPQVSAEVKEMPVKKMPKMPPKKLCKNMASGERCCKESAAAQIPALAEDAHPMQKPVYERKKKVRFARLDDCMRSLVDRCKCKEGRCTAHVEFEFLSKGMREIRRLEKLGNQETFLEDKVIEDSVPALAGKEGHVSALADKEDPTSASAEEEKNNYGGHLNIITDKTAFLEAAAIKREMCFAERNAVRAMGQTQNVVMFDENRPINAIGSGSIASPGEWQKIELAVDSGAAETVMPHNLVLDHEIVETQASRSGMCYASATDEPIPNLGELRLPLVTNEGTCRGMRFQAAPVSRPLGSVKRICQSGHRVMFDEDGSYIENKATGEINWLREDNGNYIMDLWVVPSAVSNNWGFGGQP